jgi:UDP-GlcNAc:undecaprenyl-phosphate GlcNAc-1-phosphate transferase
VIETSVILAGVGSFGVALAIGAVLTPMVRGWAVKRNFVDRPSEGVGHKAHEKPTAFGGGVAILAALLVPMIVVLALAHVLHHMGSGSLGDLLTRWSPDWPYLLGGVVDKTPVAVAVMAGALILHVLGLVDDRRPLSAYFKLLVQMAVALLLTAVYGIRSAEALGPIPSVIISTLWIVLLTNAFNFMDNMDGLAGGVAFLTAIVLAISAFLAGQIFVPCLLLLVAGAAGGFLIYNFPPASIFMGDAGSLVLGYMLAVCTVLTTFYNPELERRPFGVLVPLLVFAIPLYDAGSVILYRFRSGVNIFKGDHRHFSHRLARLGLSRTSSVLTIYLAVTATALPAILIPLLNWTGALLVFCQCICVVGIIAILESRNGS